MARISTLDSGYIPGDLSLFPEAYDDRVSLYEGRNNAETTLSQSLPQTAKTIHVDDASKFPPTGILRIGPRSGPGNSEFVYYGQRTNTTFTDLTRGFVNTIQTKWNLGTWVTNPVASETHNALKDAIIKIQDRLGTKEFPDPESLNGLLTALEVKYIAPKPSFRAFPKSGPPALNVRFQNFSNSDVIRFLWDFGDGTTSIEESPNHVYQAEGIYTVKLNMITKTGSQASIIKSNYITVSEESKPPFFYFTQSSIGPPFSQDTATTNSTSPATFEFVDQTDGLVSQRFWVFDDGETESQIDANIHVTTHVYEHPGEYEPFLLVVFTDGTLKRVFPQDTLIVL